MKESNNKESKDGLLIVDWAYSKFQHALNAKAPLSKKWLEYLDAYNGENHESKVDYKSDLNTNFIFSTLEGILPIMADEEAVFEVLPRNENGVESADVLNKCMEYEFDRENMRTKIIRGLRTCLQLGTAVFFLPWDGSSGDDGNVKCMLVNPFNIFPDPNATSVEDAEYIIYATYKHVNQLKKLFPDKKEDIVGGDIKHRELAGNQNVSATTDTQVLVLEVWCRDYTYIDVEEEVGGQIVKKKKRQFPNGRVMTIAPELGVLLDDKQNPYKDGKFPFVLLKDHDISFEFWGKGEIEQLMSPQKYINELSNQIIDNAKTTANMPWIIDKNAGIGVGKVTNRPGIIIRKNPGSEVRRDAPPPMPGYVSQQVEQMKLDIETISGVHDVTQGRRPSGIQAGNAIMALQEAGQARIRVKIKLLEESLSELARMWYSRMKQFWVMDRYVRIADQEGNFEFLTVNKKNFEHEFDIKIKSGSTMQKNKASMLDLYIRLAQTMAEDGLPMIDRESVLEYTPIPNKREVLKKFEGLKNDQVQQQMQQTQQAYEEQKQMLEQQIQQITQAVQQTTQEVKQLSGKVETVIKEHDAIKLEERLTDAKVVGYEQGVTEIQNKMLEVMQEDENSVTMDNSSAKGLDVNEAMGVGSDINEETIAFLNSLEPAELMAILEQYPELKEVIMGDMGGQMPMQQQGEILPEMAQGMMGMDMGSNMPMNELM